MEDVVKYIILPMKWENFVQEIADYAIERKKRVKTYMCHFPKNRQLCDIVEGFSGIRPTIDEIHYGQYTADKCDRADEIIKKYSIDIYNIL